MPKDPASAENRAVAGPRPLAGHDIDDAADGVAAVKRALRAAQDLDPLDIGRHQVREVEFRPAARVVDLHAVDQHQGLVGFGATHADLGQGYRSVPSG